MRLNQRLLESENHTQQYLGSIPSIIRADYEDDFIQALDDCHVEGRLEPFRNFLDKWAREVGWPESVYKLCKHDDMQAWYTVHLMTCTLQRMMHRYERSANILLQWGTAPDDLPPGTEFLNQ